VQTEDFTFKHMIINKKNRNRHYECNISFHLAVTDSGPVYMLRRRMIFPQFRNACRGPNRGLGGRDGPAVTICATPADPDVTIVTFWNAPGGNPSIRPGPAPEKSS
jgi:hypothetical protein